MTNWPEYARQGAEAIYAGHQHMTVGFLKDWLEACSLSDDVEILFDDLALGVRYQVTRHGQPALMETYLEEGGVCYTNWQPIPSQDVPVSFAWVLQRARENSLESITRPYNPDVDDKPEVDGWDHVPAEKETPPHG